MLLLAPLEVNGDGVGYLKAAHAGSTYPGHLGYLPLLRAVWACWRRLFHAPDELAVGIWPARLVSAVGAGVAAAATGAFVAARVDRARGLVASLGMLASAGLLVSGCDIESYAPATAALALTVALLDDGGPAPARAACAGLALAAAALLHVENLVFSLPVWLLCRDHRTRACVFSVAGPALLAAYLPALSSLHAMTHGYAYPLHAWTPLVALWGAGRTLVHAPYLYEASLLRVALCTALGAIAALSLWALTRARTALAALPRVVVLGWLVPYALVGALYFASDSERWIFLLPLLWIVVASRARPRPLAVLAALLLVANVALWSPRARDDRGLRLARRAAATLAPGDLVVSPGHGWDEQLPLVAPFPIVPFPLVFHAAARGGEAGLVAALDDAMADARRRGARTVTVRLDDTADPSDALGWKELATLGLDRARIAQLLRARGLAATSRR